jgi:hypothetical protein
MHRGEVRGEGRAEDSYTTYGCVALRCGALRCVALQVGEVWISQPAGVVACGLA